MAQSNTCGVHDHNTTMADQNLNGMLVTGAGEMIPFDFALDPFYMIAQLSSADPQLPFNNKLCLPTENEADHLVAASGPMELDESPALSSSCMALIPFQDTSFEASQVVVPIASYSQQATPLEPPLSRNRPTGKDWEVHRSTITQLYSVQNKTLDEVRAIMEKEYNFFATPKMFKARIVKWNIKKNYTAKERKDLVQIAQFYQRRGENCPKITVGGRPVKMHRVWRHCKNPQLSLTRVQALQNLYETWMDEPTTEVELYDLQRRLGSASKPRRPLRMPPQQEYAERLLSQTDILCESLIELSLNDNENSMSPGNHTPEVQTIVKPAHVFDALESALYMLGTKQDKAGWRLLDKALEKMTLLFSANSIYTFIHILNYMPSWSQLVAADIFGSVLRFMCDMASTKLGDENPTSQICHCITHIDLRLESSERALELMMKNCEKRLGQHHDETMFLRDSYCGVLEDAGELDKAESLYRQDFEYNNSRDGYSYNSIYSLYGLGWIYREKRDLVEAEATFQDALQRCQVTRDDDSRMRELEMYIVLNLTLVLDAKGEFAQSQQLLEDALEKLIESEDSEMDDWVTFRLLGALHSNLEYQGKFGEAETLRMQYPDAFDG